MGRTEIDISPVVPLGDAHILASFDCGEPSLDRWLKERARQNLGLLASSTYVIHRSDVVVGYYAISTGATIRSILPGSIRRNMPEPMPSILLGRLAVDRTMQGQGLGGSLLTDALSRSARVASVIASRVVLVDAISDDARRFYARFGFVETLDNPMRLALDLRALIEVAR